MPQPLVTFIRYIKLAKLVGLLLLALIAAPSSAYAGNVGFTLQGVLLNSFGEQ